MKVQGWLVAFSCLVATAAALAADNSRRVGDLGSPSRLSIDGAKTFTADEIREALFDELEIVAVCEKNAPLEKFRSLIAEKIVAGYRCAGFPDAEVTVVAGDDRLTVTIDKGDRFNAGEIQVIGAQTVDAERIKEELTQANAAAGKRPLWKLAKPAPFETEYRDWLTTKIADLLADQGYYRAKLKIVVEPDRATNTATLNVVIIDEGAPTTLSDLELVGNEIHHRQDLLAYLGVDSQRPLTRELREQIAQQLRRSGRFVSVGWELGDVAKRDLAWRPRLSLREYPLAPALGEPLTREEAALLKLAEWVETFHESDQEVIIRMPDEHLSIIFAPRHGVMILLEPSQEAREVTTAAGFLNAVVMAEERVGLYSPRQRRKIDAAPPPGPMMGNAKIVLIDGSKSMTGRGMLMAGAGLRRTSSTTRRHVEMRLELSAAAALSVIRTHQAKTQWEGDVVCFEWMHRRMRVNSLTGQLIEQVIDPNRSADGTLDPDDIWNPHITVGSGQFERRLAEIEKVSAGWTNAADGRRPLSSIAEFACDELKYFNAASQPGYAAISKLFAHGFATPVR